MTTIVLDSSGPNAEQIRYWNDTAASKWVELQRFIDDLIGPLGHVALDAADLRAGERILDVGCGCGNTTMDLARRVGPTGSVLGVDISGVMLAEARRACQHQGIANASFHQADAQTYSFEGSFDVTFSRFGVMFFSDPPAAFANLALALRAGGRLTFLCWQGLQRNPWMMVPLEAALQHLPPPPLPKPDTPGPFAFADADRVRSILGSAGFTQVTVEPLQEVLTVGGNTEFDQAIDFVLKMGPVGRMLDGADPAIVPAVETSVRQALEPHRTPQGIRMPSAAWLVTGRKP